MVRKYVYVFFGCFLLLLSLSLSIACSGGECTYDSDCEGEKFCQEGKCVNGIVGNACTLNTDCQTGESCISSKCIKVECTDGEQTSCYEGPTGTIGQGTCKAGVKLCQGGRWGWCEGAITPSSELCDKLDNDCNGKIDDDPLCTTTCNDGDSRPCYTGPASTRNVGLCREGKELCTNGAWEGCSGDTKPVAEKCNDNLDNNCDGNIDENCGDCQDGQSRACYTGPSSTRNIGECKEGTQTCAGGKWGQCQNESTPQNETCGDNKDNDCNGRVDELASCNQGCTDGTTRACYTGPAGTKDVGVCKGGGQLCKNNKWEACVGEIVPTTEICGDGKDNNCNNKVDDNCGVCRPGSQEACYSGTTGCTKNGNVYTCNTPCSAGTRTCKADGQWGPCTGETTPAAKEICGDNIDNDCNNFIDDNCNTKLHQPCQTDTDCGTGNRCVRASNVLQICVQECTNDPTICNKNPKRKVCRAYTITDQGQQLSMCAEEASSGQSCDFSKSIMCKSNLVCDNGSCRAATYVNEGEICDSTAATPVLCALGLTCVSFGNGRPNVCLKLCSVANPARCSRSSFSCMPFQTGGQVGGCIQTTCTQNSDCVFTNTPHECVSTSSGGKLCVSSTSPGTATFGNICDNNTIRCQAGLTCLATSSTAANGFCSQDCTTSGTCPTGGTCTQVSTTQKMCLIPCTTTCSNTQFTCQTIGQLGNFCFPN